MIMNKKVREYIDSLYPKNRTWTNDQIMDVMMYFGNDGLFLRYKDDHVHLYDFRGRLVNTFWTYSDFVRFINGEDNSGD